jgi:hypothetical protein
MEKSKGHKTKPPGLWVLLLVMSIGLILGVMLTTWTRQQPQRPPPDTQPQNLVSDRQSQNLAPATVQGNARGYMTTPQELILIAQKAAQNIEPYHTAVEALLTFAGEPDYWPYGTITGERNCSKPLQPEYIGKGSPLIYAKAMAYHLTGNSAYAAAVRVRLRDLTDTYGYGGEIYSGANQCILNLSWYLPGWIMAADLIEDYSDWRTTDKQLFQQWLADEIYSKTAWASRNRINNWGTAASATSGMIADYLADSPYLLEGATPPTAYAEHKQRQLDRMNGSWQGDSECNVWGIREHGGIPDELRRGASGCEAQWIVDQDASWTYTQTHLEGLVTHAEFLLRRGDNSIYENISSDGSGSLLKAIHFIINNPADPSKSINWKNNHKPTLEVTYRYYRDAPTAKQLRVGQPDRFIGGKSGQMLHFGTITHGFAPDENPELPPTVPPPGQ